MKVVDYRELKAKSHRLQAESLRLEAQATRLFADHHMALKYRENMYINALSSEQSAETYDQLASELEADIAADSKSTGEPK